MVRRADNIRYFVVLAHARSGSSLLMDCIGQHPHALNLDELFGDTDAERPDLPRSFQRLNPSSERRYSDGRSGADFLRHIFFEAVHPHPIGAVGCKLLFNQCRDRPKARTIWPFLEGRPDIQIIRLYRRNILETWVSEQTAMLTGLWHFDPHDPDAAPNDASTLPRLTVPVEEFEGYAWELLKFMKSSERQFRHHKMMTIEYSRQLCQEFDSTMSSIFSFLSLPQYPVRRRLVKLAKSPARKAITNYDEVMDYFRNSPLSPYVSAYDAIL